MQLRLNGFRVVILVLLSVGLISCSGSSVISITPTAGADANTGSPQSEDGVAFIPVQMSPVQSIELPVRGFSQALPPGLADVPYPRSASYTEEDLTKQGSAIDQALPYNRVAFSAPPYVLFDPDYTDQAGHTGLSYCMYRFAISGYDQQTTVGFTWQTPPEYTDFYMGLGNRYTNSWDWYAGEMDNVITVADFDDYLASGGVLLMALMMVGSDQAALESITIGENELYPLGAIMPAAYSGSAPPMYASGTLPASFDLSPDMSPIRDQYPCGSCTAFGFGDGAYNYILGQLYSGWDFGDDFNLVSPKHLYLRTWEGLPQPLDGGRDMDYVATYLTGNVEGEEDAGGVCSEETVPYINWYDFDFPPKADIEASYLKPDHSERIPCNTDTGILSVKEILVNQSLPVVMATLVDLGFSAVPPDDNNHVWNYAGPPVGGHCMCIAGYDDAKQAFKVRNSWGVGWGNDGYCWIGYGTFKNTAANASCYTITDSYSEAVEQYFVGGAGNPTPPPALVRASDGTHSEHITITWNKAAGAGQYEIYRDNKSTKIQTVDDVSSYNDPVGDLATHSYWVRGIFNGTPGDFSMPDMGYRQQGLSIVDITPTSGNTNTSTTFQLTPAGETPQTYAWNFGGGATPNTSALSSPTVTLTGTPGYYSCSVTVTATSGNATKDFTLTVNYYNEPPAASLIADPVSGLGPLSVNFNAAASNDPDGENSNLTYKWDWTNNGTYDYDSGSNASASHEYEFAEDPYVCKVLVTDEGGATDTATATITVEPTGSIVWDQCWGVNQSSQYALALGKDTSGRRYAIGIGALPVNETYAYYATIVRYTNTSIGASHRFKFADGDILPQDGWVMPDGTCYICGFTNWSGGYGDDDIFVAKFDADGNRLADWVGGTDGHDRADVIFVDDEGYVYLYGSSTKLGAGQYDMLLIKLSSDLGNPLWTKTWGTPSNDQGWTAGKGLYVNSSGDIYVVGASQNWDSNWDAVMIHVPTNGADSGIWAYRWSTSASDDLNSIDADAFGNLILGGHCNSAPAVANDYLVLKVTPYPATKTASLVWDNLYGGTVSDGLSGVAVATSGHIFATGKSGNTESEFRMQLTRIDYNGDMVWNQQLDSPLHSFAEPCRADASGTILIAGGGQDDTGVFEPGYFTQKAITGLWEPITATVSSPSLSWKTANGTVTSFAGSSGTGGEGYVDMLMMEFDPDNN